MLGKKEIKFFRYPSCTFAIVSNVCIYLNIMKIININGELKKKKRYAYANSNNSLLFILK